MAKRIKLTDKDIEVLDLLGKGKTEAQIAVWMNVSHSAIIGRISGIRSRIGLKGHIGDNSKRDLLEWMSRNGWEVKCLQSLSSRGSSLGGQNITPIRLNERESTHLV